MTHLLVTSENRKDIIMPFIIFFAIFCLWLMYELKKNTRLHKKRSDAFWETERQADATRKKDISHLAYLTIPFDELPLHEALPDQIKRYQDAILALKDQPILNLSGQTNTELKSTYGAANLDALSICDSNYTTLVSNLARLGTYYYEQGDDVRARKLLEYGILIGTDVSSNYVTLARIYLKQNETDRIYDLMAQISESHSLLKDSILQKLHALLAED